MSPESKTLYFVLGGIVILAAVLALDHLPYRDRVRLVIFFSRLEARLRWLFSLAQFEMKHLWGRGTGWLEASCPAPESAKNARPLPSQPETEVPHG